ncbi:MAG TPA: hypothetical protein VM010_00390, partial [Chitinophagaceae bacterium]|nr:hypothetical protein [Chitinophagaceae bacterium]
KYLAPSFNNRLALLNSVSSETAKPTVADKETTTTSAYTRFLSRLFANRGAERMGFLITWKLTGRSRDFKVKVYPSIGYLLVIVVMMFLRNGNGVSLNNMADGKERGLIISALYFTSILLLSAVNQMAQSDKFKAAWLYFIAPLQQPGAVISGSLKAALCKFYLPVVLTTTLVSLYFIGLPVLPNIILGLCNQLLITTLMVYGNAKVFPFSTPPNNNANGGNFLKTMMLLIVSGAIGFSHYLVYNITPVVLLFTVLSGLATWLLLSSIRETPWTKIKSAYADA